MAEERRDSAERLRRLAAFASRLRSGEPKGSWSDPTGAGTPESPLTLPHYQASDIEDAFVSMCYAAGWVVPFDWPAWTKTEEGRMLLHDPAALAMADEPALEKFLTAVIRGERFNEGLVGGYRERGFLLAAAERAGALLSGRGTSAAAQDGKSSDE